MGGSIGYIDKKYAVILALREDYYVILTARGGMKPSTSYLPIKQLFNLGGGDLNIGEGHAHQPLLI
jgi:hypothetical protein